MLGSLTRPALVLLVGATALLIHFVAGDPFLSGVLIAGLGIAWWQERRAASGEMKAAPESLAASVPLDSAQHDLTQLRRLMSETFASLSSSFTSLEQDATEQNRALTKLIADVEGAEGITIGKFLNDNSEGLAFFVELVMNISQQGVRTVQKIDDMTHQIDGAFRLLGQVERIANQTNLLSINAMIESERAGEAGLGFRVVAGEVKKLSQTTRSLSEQIRDQISAVRQTTNDARTTVAQMASNDLNGFLESKAHIDVMVDQLAQLDARLSASLREISTRSQRVESNVAGGARALQFEGMGGELVEHIQRLLRGEEKAAKNQPETAPLLPHARVEQTVKMGAISS
jgi:hypothetical protein